MTEVVKPQIDEVQRSDYDNQARCPWCESDNTRMTSPYGPSVAEMQFKCIECGQGFGWMKWQQRLPET